MSLPTKTKQWILTKKPTTLPVLEGDEATFTLETKDIGALQDGELLLQTLYLSNDPAQRYLHNIRFSTPTNHAWSYAFSHSILSLNTQNQGLDIRKRRSRTILHAAGTNRGSHERTRDLQSARFKSCQYSKGFLCCRHMRLVRIQNPPGHRVPTNSGDTRPFDHTLSGRVGRKRLDGVLRICR